MEKKSISTVAFALSVLTLSVLSCKTTEMEMDSSGETTLTFYASFNEGSASKVSLESTANNLDLVSKWTGGDKLDVYVNEELAKRNVPLQEISEDAKSAYFSLNLSPEIFPGNADMLCISTEGNPIKEDGKIYVNASLVRSPLSTYRPPVYARDLISDKDRNTTSLQFRHYLAYEVVHIQNASGKEISFSLNGYYTAAGTWYREKGSKSFSDNSFRVDAKATEDPITKSDFVTIPPNASDAIISAYIPNGYEIKEAMMVAEIDGQIVNSSNLFSSWVIMQVGHAYHLYVVWDGATLRFTTSTGEGGSEVDAGGSGYGSDNGGDVIGGGTGYTYDEAGNVIASGSGYGSDTSGQISGGGSGYSNGN